MEKSELEQMRVLFRVAFFLAKSGRPFTDFPGQIKLLAVNNVPVSETYANDKQARIFTDYIYESKRVEMIKEMSESEFFAILSDGSTDTSITDEEIVYVKYIKNGRPTYRFVTFKPLVKADAPSITAALQSTMEENLERKTWKNDLVAASFDGANVMMGSKSGVATRLKEDVPHLVVVHCFAHRLELAVKDVLKQMPYLTVVHEFLQKVYLFYKYSPLNWAAFKNAGEALCISVVRPVNVSGTRWVPHHERGVQALLRNYKVHIAHIEDVRIHGGKESKDKAVYFLKMLKSVKFVMFCKFLQIYFRMISVLSKCLQDNEVTVERVRNMAESVKKLMVQYKDEDKLKGCMMEGISTNADGKLVYEGILLQEGPGRPQRNVDNHTQSKQQEAIKESKKAIELTVQCIDNRFQDLVENEILKSTVIFDPAMWPTETEALEVYGDDEVKCLYSHFKQILEYRGCNEIDTLIEWTALKKIVRKIEQTEGQSLKYLDIWQRVMLVFGDNYKCILMLVKIVLLIPCSTAVCERGFSLMSVIKK
ncbi:zinc finger protein 862-like [Saccoglossus kowalevskii]|uniref:Zinc finger protein 862-like n=1 Tax=Saccoglossus kowalevskii TaxID=10224 RepID=A0ABM0M355_SACKO|nr:PREDICTED: zinc finger protein 862-like [Saccoglossus kowalevskii]